ncbi:uncharacterized protein L3040_001624 [Drepanopeziza brunnea f. sp. 'multigermtubi']|uniref:uncharacterized protein n=1 Tax=Drepanopeziza brunnea f. sp. 'multigermtubi' TaxID=698441 RepID=UPI00239DDFE8|nr:hypothetical protein L3040_001624 [Drepanopeziza brunnea f. sp. 'multigermtubi']
MASSLVSNPYTAQPLLQNPAYTYVTAPQPPPSPPVDEVAKCSLPSISSLFSFADGSSPLEQQAPQQQSPQPAAQASQKSEHRPESAQPPYGPSPVMASRGALPPTPPMHSDAGYDGRHSPSAASSSSYSAASAPGYYFSPSGASPINSNVEPSAQRPQAPPLQRQASLPSANLSYAPTPYNNNTTPYAVSPQQSMGAYYPNPMQPAAPAPSHMSGLYYQRPLPQQFPPPLMPVAVTLTPSSGANPWQHHHYISPSSAASFPQSQDRYICQTCNKAFSRPSSLRIHSHSHTGEKPFKCPHHGCGKAFSVRSNMKRHERGCHSFEGGAMM